MPGFFPNTSRDKELHVQRLVAEVLRRGGWSVRERPVAHDGRPDISFEHAGKKFVIECKMASEGRKDRLIPLVSQAILQAQGIARSLPGHPVPVAIVVANYIPESLAEQVKRFVQQYAPDIGVGVMDFEGLRLFAGHGLERLNTERPRDRVVGSVHRAPSPQLFSDLNQWMLKVLLAPSIPERYLAAPRGRYQGASQLAKTAAVSVMTAFRFIQQFSKAGFLEEGRKGLRVVRIEELMNRWLAASQRSVPEIGVRWVLRGKKNALWGALRSYVWCEEKQYLHSEKAHSVVDPRACLALFAAAEALGLGFVHGVQPYLYMERIEPRILEKLGLSANSVDVDPDVYIRVPRNDESVFRSVVLNGGVPVCDALQVWLDVAQHPSRGKKQADLIWRRILAPVLLAT